MKSPSLSARSRRGPDRDRGGRLIRRAPTIDSFGAGGFRVGGAWRPGSLLILDDVAASWRPRSLIDVTLGDFAAVLDAGPAVSEFVLLGTGATQAPPPRALRLALEQAGLGLEFMSTQTAARTYDLLVSEGRRLAAALICV
jgi:uncharacterized protein